MPANELLKGGGVDNVLNIPEEFQKVAKPGLVAHNRLDDGFNYDEVHLHLLNGLKLQHILDHGLKTNNSEAIHMPTGIMANMINQYDDFMDGNIDDVLVINARHRKLHDLTDAQSGAIATGQGTAVAQLEWFARLSDTAPAGSDIRVSSEKRAGRPNGAQKFIAHTDRSLSKGDNTFVNLNIGFADSRIIRRVFIIAVDADGNVVDAITKVRMLTKGGTNYVARFERDQDKRARAAFDKGRVLPAGLWPVDTMENGSMMRPLSIRRKEELKFEIECDSNDITAHFIYETAGEATINQALVQS